MNWFILDWIKTIAKNANVVTAAKTLGKAILYAVLSTVGVTWMSGCSSAAPSARGQTTEIVAVGIPAVAWISHSTMCETNAAGDTNGTLQVNPVVVGK